MPDGQFDDKDCALAFLAVHTDTPIHSLDHLVHQRESHARTNVATVATSLVERLKDVPYHLPVHTNPIIAYRQHKHLVLLVATYVDGTISASKLDGIHDKINVSSTNSEQSKLCINSPLYIDTRLFGEQAIGCNSA